MFREWTVKKTVSVAVATAWRCVIALVFVVSGIAPAQQPMQFGGPAPAPMCYVQADQIWGGPECSPPMIVQGAYAAIQEACKRFARSHSLHLGGAHTWSCVAGSEVTSCEFSNPTIRPDYVGGVGANVLLDFVGLDVEPSGNPLVRQPWGTSIYGPGCDCPGGSLIKPDATCACPVGQSWNELTQRCEVAPYRIELIGASSTKALIAGPVLAQTAKVTSNGAPVSGRSVTVTITGGATAGGTTNGAGEFNFTYVPPYKATTDTLTGTCDGCASAATKQINVQSCDLCGGVGNPIQPATGEKLQDESDWFDSGAHPLSFVRHYRSLYNTDAGMGPMWSHNYAATAFKGNADSHIRFGDGRKVLFKRAATGGWVADNYKDTLAEDAAGLTYTRASDESRWRFDGTGRLLSITQRNGWTMSMAYAADRLQSVTNAFGRRLQFNYSAQGKLVGVTAPDGQQISYGYDSMGRLATATFAGNVTRGYQYNDSRWPWALTGIVDETNTTYASFSYDDTGRAVSTQHAGAAGSFNVTYSGGTTAVGTLTTAAVDPNLFQSSAQVNDPLGTQRTYTWLGGDGQIRLAGTNGSFDGNRTASTGFGPLQLPQSETDFTGVQTTYTWDTARVLNLSTTRAAGRPEAQTRTTQWHPTFRLPTLITEAGRTTAYEYDAQGNTLSETVTDTATGASRTTRWSYTSNGLVATMTDANGGVWRYGYDSVGNQRSVKNPAGHETTYTHDGAGRVLSQTEPSGLVTTYVYDARGRMTSLTQGGETTSYQYNALGLLTNVQLPSGYSQSYQYDAAQRLRTIADNLGATIQYELDAAGNRVSERVLDANGNLALQTGKLIDSFNRVRALTGAQGQTTQLAYNANGEPVSVTDPLQQTTAQSLDGLSRPTRTTLPDNASVTTDWNALDQLTQVTDPKGVKTGYEQNALGDVKRQTSADGGNVTYEHDAAGNVIASTDAKGIKTAITRDALGRPTEIRYGSEPAQQFEWDSNKTGYLASISDKTGSLVFVRDAQGRITSKTSTVLDNPTTPSSYTVTYSYAAGELAGMTYPSGLAVSYQRTAGRITGVTVREPGTARKPKPTIPFISSLTHTALGQPQSWTWSTGDTAARTFDTDGRMTATEFSGYGYDAAGRITSITQELWAQRTTTLELYRTPLTWTAGYDNRDRLTSFTRAGASTHYTYDANSNRLTSIDKTTSDTDIDGQFTEQDAASTTSQVSLMDGDSNRLLGFTQTLTTMSNGKVKSVVTAPVNYIVNANGSMTSDGLREFDYDAANRLAKVTVSKDGEAARVVYLTNAMGQRVFKSVTQAEQTLPDETTLDAGFIAWLKKSFGWLFTTPTTTGAGLGTAYVYGDGPIPAWAMLGEYDNGSAVGKGRTEYIWLPTQDGQALPVGMYRNGKFYAVHADHLGTPRLITDEANKPVWQWPYSAFGNNTPTGVLQVTPNPKQAITNQPVLLKASKPIEMNLRFPGQYFDAETGLFYNWMREYCARCGRYVQSDQIGLDGGPNRFAYASGNPMTYVDPKGQNGLAIGGLVLGLGALAIIEMSRPKIDLNTSSNEQVPTGEQCCTSFTDIYEPNDGKHGSVQRGDISPEPANATLALQNSVGAGRSKVGYDGLSGQIVVFRLTRIDEIKCIKYWHGYVVYQRDLTPEQWKAGRDAGFPNWPRKPK